MGDDARADRLQALGMLASALAGRAVAVADCHRVNRRGPTARRSTSMPPRARSRNSKAVAVQASLIAAGSLEPDVVRALVRHRKLAKRYLAIEATGRWSRTRLAAKHFGVAG